MKDVWIYDKGKSRLTNITKMYFIEPERCEGGDVSICMNMFGKAEEMIVSGFPMIQAIGQSKVTLVEDCENRAEADNVIPRLACLLKMDENILIYASEVEEPSKGAKA